MVPHAVRPVVGGRFALVAGAEDDHLVPRRAPVVTAVDDDLVHRHPAAILRRLPPSHTSPIELAARGMPSA